MSTLARDHAGQTPTNWNQGDLQAHWADLDNDGLLDLLVCESDYPQNHLRLFLQKPDHTFAKRALGDYDGDGDIDILATGSTTRWPQARPKPALALFENHLAPPTNGWLKVRLLGNGTSANTNATGARVTLTTGDGRTQTREVSGPYGHWAAQTEPGEVHFGLGTAAVTSLKIVWPDAKRTQTLLTMQNRTAPARNSVLTLRQNPPTP